MNKKNKKKTNNNYYRKNVTNLDLITKQNVKLYLSEII